MPALRTLAFAALLAACAAEPRWTLAHPADAPARQGAWSIELTDEGGRTLPTFEHRGRTYVLGEPGQRYLLRVRNGSGRRVEVVASVDGRDVTDGQPAAWERRGYLVEPHGEVMIDGYRLSQASVAAFRFGSVASSYAAAKGDVRDVGVIGVAVFQERAVAQRPSQRPLMTPYPYPQYEGPSSRSEAAPTPSGDAAGGGRAEKRGGAEAAPSAAAPRVDRERPGLGTEFGEAHGSPVYEVAFVRASSRPATVLTLRYDDRRGLAAAGVDLDRWAWHGPDNRWLREQANPFRSSGTYAEPPPGWRPY